MKYVTLILTAATCAATLLTATSCTMVEFDNPLDPKGNNYLYGDKACEEEKIKDNGEGAGLFTNPELSTGCGK